MADTGELVLQGQAEVQAALNKVKAFSVEKAAARVVTKMMPNVKAGTRKRYGVLQAALTQDGDTFLNPMPYSVVQEFGGVYVEPTLSIFKVAEAAPDAIKDAFALEIVSEAKQAGFDA